MSKTQQFLDYIKETRSKNTHKEYKHGINAFSQWYGKSSDEILEERRQDVASGDFERNMRLGREVDKFHSWLIKEGYRRNTARTKTIGIKQLFKFYGMPIKTQRYDTVISTRDFVPTIEQYRAMYNVSPISTRLAISMGLDLGWRVGDLLSLRKQDLPDLTQQAPIPIELITEKAKVISKTFLSAETVELLKAYIPTIEDKTNPFLFPSNGKGHLRGEAINEKLRTACRKAKIKIPKGKRLRFHAFRKRFLSTCANLRIDVNIAKILCGKSVRGSMLEYLSEVDHLTAFKEVREQYLSLTNGRIKSEMQAKDETILKLQKRLKDLELILKGFGEVFGEEIVKKAMQKIDVAKHSGKPLSPIEALTLLGKMREKEEQEEYKRLIEENNNNNH